jgi:hypothetical protein
VLIAIGQGVDPQVAPETAEVAKGVVPAVARAGVATEAAARGAAATAAAAWVAAATVVAAAG